MSLSDQLSLHGLQQPYRQLQHRGRQVWGASWLLSMHFVRTMYAGSGAVVSSKREWAR